MGYALTEEKTRRETKAGPAPKHGHAEAEEKVTTYPVTRKLEGNRTTCSSLSRERDGQFLLKLGCGLQYRVSRQKLVEATATARNSWTTIKIDKFGTESYTLNRLELRTAFQQLDKP